jgi:hypothetical protein
MPSNSKTIIQDIRQEFEILLDFVTGEPGHRRSNRTRLVQTVVGHRSQIVNIVFRHAV